MPASAEALTFMNKMVEQLDETLRDLAKRERSIATVLGSERVDELKELWDQTLTPEDEYALCSGMDWRDRELLWVWARQRRAYASRASAGQAIMRIGAV